MKCNTPLHIWCAEWRLDAEHNRALAMIINTAAANQILMASTIFTELIRIV
jgi:hypothetical protein